MKIQSIKSIATLVAAAGLLSSTVLAGPGPKGAPQDTNSQTSKAVTTIAVYPNSQSVNSKPTETANPRTPHVSYTAHGGVNIL